MWITLTFVAVLLWSMVNIADNYLVERNKKFGHPIGSLVIFSSIFGFIAAAAIAFFVKTSLVLPAKEILILFVAGLCNVSWIIFYLKALPDEDVSSVIPWFLTAPFFAYVLGYFFLGEHLGAQQLIGGAIMLAGGLVLSVKKHEECYTIRWKLIFNMTIASLLIAAWGILFKYVGRESGFWVSSFWEHIGLGIGGLFIIVFVSSYREGFSELLKKDGKRVLTISLFSETATIVGNLLANYALLLVPVSIVLLLEVAQPAVVFILGLICTAFFPNILTEDVSRKNVIQKVISIAIMVLGALLLV
jgi:drug/metabolite transporter (DMT)-like permease